MPIPMMAPLALMVFGAMGVWQTMAVIPEHPVHARGETWRRTSHDNQSGLRHGFRRWHSRDPKPR
jgi:hypothetical protein